MKQHNSIVNVLPKYLFWDMDYSTLDLRKDKNVIIPRALFATTEDSFNKDILVLESLYSRKEILSCLKNTKERISNAVCRMVAHKYKVAPFYRFQL